MVRKRDTMVRRRYHRHPLRPWLPLALVLAGILVASGNTAAQDDPNVAPYIDDIFAYLQVRHDGALDRGRPTRAD